MMQIERYKSEINREIMQMTEVATMSDYVRDIIWKNKYMILRSKITMYKTCVRPITIHAIETRAETTITKCLIERYLSNACGSIWVPRS
jgi:hypothetical protein